MARGSLEVDLVGDVDSQLLELPEPASLGFRVELVQSSEEEAAMTMTPEQKQAVDDAGDAPVVVKDPETQESYVIVKEETYRRLAKTVEVESIDPSCFEYGEFIPRSS